MGTVSVVIVTYNRLALLKECIDSLINQDFKLDKIFIVNNNSSDGTKEYLDDLSNNRFIVSKHLKKNIGGAGGFSYGLSCAYEQSTSDYFLVMDDDTMVQNNSISELVKKADKLDFGFLCSDVRWYKDDSACLLNCPVVERNWNDRLKDGLIKVKAASFVSFMVSRNTVKELGLPISEMFIWADDVEYSTRLSHQKNSYLVSDSRVTHKCKSNNSSETILNCNTNRIHYYECMYRNRMYIYRKHYSFSYRLVYFADYIVMSLRVVFKARNKKLRRFKAVILGTLKGMFFNPRIKFPER